MYLFHKKLPLYFLFPLVLVQPLQAQEGGWTLEECLEQALQNNISIMQRKLNNELLDVGLEQNRASRFPALSASAGHGYSFGRSIDPYTNEYIEQNIGSNSVSFNSSLNLFNGFQTTNSIRQQEIDREAGQLDLEQLRKDISISLAEAYLQVLYAHEQVENAEKKLESSTAQMERTERLVRAGMVPESNLLLILSQVASDNSSLINAGNQLRMSNLNLMQVMEIPFDEGFSIHRPSFEKVLEEDTRDLSSEDAFARAFKAQPMVESSALKVASAEKDLEIARSNVLSAQANLKRAKTNLGYATILAPIDGIVIAKNVEEGQTVAASLNAPVLFQIVKDLTKMQVQASIDEADIGQIKEGQTVNFTVDAYPDDKFKGTVKQIRLQPIIVSNVVTYNVIIDVPNPDLKLMPGMTANVSVMVDERSQVLRVPARALSFAPPTAYLEDLYRELPDSVKKVMYERLEAVRERMLSMGMSKTDIEQRIDQIRGVMITSGNAGGGFGGGRAMGPGAGGAMGGGFPGAGMGTGGMQMTNPSQMAAARRSFGQVWVHDGDKLKMLRVRAGLSDGSYVEVTTEELGDGDMVVVGAIYPEKKQRQSQTQQSPFMPQRGTGRGRM